MCLFAPVPIFARDPVHDRRLPPLSPSLVCLSLVQEIADAQAVLEAKKQSIIALPEGSALGSK